MEGKGKGYVTWAKRFNAKQMAKTVLFLQEHKIESYGQLKEMTDERSGRLKELNDYRRKDICTEIDAGYFKIYSKD